MHPQTLTDPVFGTLKKDEDLSFYEGSAEWTLGTTIRIWINYYEDEPLMDMSLIQQRFRVLQGQELGIRQSAIGDLLQAHNKFWNEGEPIDAATFAQRMTLETIHFWFMDKIELSYDDGDLFWGHTIVIALDGTFKVLNASFWG